jgi:hypothetical protein
MPIGFFCLLILSKLDTLNLFGVAYANIYIKDLTKCQQFNNEMLKELLQKVVMLKTLIQCTLPAPL